MYVLDKTAENGRLKGEKAEREKNDAFKAGQASAAASNKADVAMMAALLGDKKKDKKEEKSASKDKDPKVKINMGNVKTKGDINNENKKDEKVKKDDKKDKKDNKDDKKEELILLLI